MPFPGAAWQRASTSSACYATLTTDFFPNAPPKACFTRPPEGSVDLISSRPSPPRDRRLVRSVLAQLRVLEGDTALAIAILQSLEPRARRLELGWWPWESLGLERLLLASLLLVQGHHEEALRVVSLLDATEPIGYPMYLASSLEVRAQAAAVLGRAREAERYRARLERLAVAP